MAAEQRLEQVVVNYAKERDIITYKFTSPANRGVPDRVFIFPGGVVLWIEFKAPKKKPDALQTRTILKMVKHGAFVAVVDTSLAAYDIIDKLLTKKIVLTDKFNQQRGKT